VTPDIRRELVTLDCLIRAAQNESHSEEVRDAYKRGATKNCIEIVDMVAFDIFENAKGSESCFISTDFAYGFLYAIGWPEEWDFPGVFK
jgi:hypothetical protein